MADEDGEIDRLGEVGVFVPEAELEEPEPGDARGDGEGQAGPEDADPVGEADAVHRARHRHVGEDEVDAVPAFEDGDRVGGAGRRHHVETFVAQGVAAEKPDQGLVLDDENRDRTGDGRGGGLDFDAQSETPGDG